MVNVSAQSPGIANSEDMDIKFGLQAALLEPVYTNISEKVFEFQIHNDLAEMIYGVAWNCSEGLAAQYATNLTGNQTWYDFMQYNYSTPGKKSFACTGTSEDGTDSLGLDFDIKSLEIEDYDILATDISRKVMSFNAKNYYHPLEANISASGGDGSFSTLANISSNAFVMVLAEVNYTNDGANTFEAELSTNGSSDRYEHSFTIDTAMIENYQRLAKNYTDNIIMFDVVNNWHDGDVTWELSDPELNDTAYLAHNETLIVVIENNYSAQGSQKAQVSAHASSAIDRISDIFEIRPLEILDMQTLYGSVANSVFALTAKNNINAPLLFSWKLDTGIENISSDEPVNISDKVFIFIETNYTSAGVYRTKAVINTTGYNDTETGVVIA